MTKYNLETYIIETGARINRYDGCEGEDAEDACAILAAELREYPEYRPINDIDTGDMWGVRVAPPSHAEVVALAQASGIVDGTGTLYTVCEQAIRDGEGTPGRVREIWDEATREAEADRLHEAGLCIGARVEAGEGDDRETGRIVEINGTIALVSWDSGVSTSCPVARLRPTTERWSGAIRTDG